MCHPGEIKDLNWTLKLQLEEKISDVRLIVVVYKQCCHGTPVVDPDLEGQDAIASENQHWIM